MATELRDGKEVFTLSAPCGAFGAYFTSARAAAFMAVIFITAQMREGDIFQRPEKLDTYALPRLFVFDTQLLGSRNYFRTFKANVLTVLAQNVEENHFAQTVTRRPVRHA
ncbi:MAG TPA: hypothetical protein VM936_14445 [Pyrinomonadaceae bacterium]|jgi:hypothetical protein|nr:hypothetical protein [Pyrinomonadaceae bacterium]